jgi:hypothetical protein
MGNALDAARISIAKGFTGVSDPTSTLSAITKGIETISDWKTKREEAKEKLKKDTSDEYLAAEKKAYENMPTDKTFKTNVLEGLESYKERLYTNMKLVQRGVVSNNDNLIFRENATQGIGIVSDMQKNYAKIQEDYLKGARGYTKEDGTFVNPIYGSGAAALNDIHVQMNNPDLYSLTFNEKGSAEVVMYETEVGPNSVMIAKRDKNGDRIPVKGADGKRASNINAMAFDGGNNQVMGIIDLNAQSAKLTGDGTVYARDFQEIINTKGMMGVITDDIKANKKDGLSDLIKSTAASMINGIDSQLSVLTDNGPKAEQSQSMSPAMYARLTPEQKAETIEYNYFNFETGKMDKREKTRFIPLKMMSNNQYVPQFQERDIEAYTNITEFSIYNSLEKSIKSAGSQFRPKTAAQNEVDKEKSYFNLIDDVVVDGNENSLSAIVRQNEDLTSYYFTSSDPKKPELRDQVVFMRLSGTPTAAIPIGAGTALDAGKLFASELGYSADEYAVKSRSKENLINKGIGGFEDFSKPKGAYSGLGNLSVGGISQIGGVTKPQKATDYLVKGTEAKMAAKAQEIVDVARSKYDNIPDIKVTYDPGTLASGDEIIITVDGVSYTNKGYESDNHAWLLENLDRALRQKPGGKTKKKKLPGIIEN